MSDTPWGGRFAEAPAADLLSFSSSVDVDRRLWPEDIAGSRAHVAALERGGLLTSVEAAELLDGLREVSRELESGAFEWKPIDEDVHMAIERRLTEMVGPVGGKLHTGRSRNDQVATDLRLYMRRRCREVAAAVGLLAEVLLRHAVDAGEAVTAGYTHLQRAQPVLLAHHLAAHAWALVRDGERLLRAADAAAEECPLGAGALSGTGLLLDPASTARDLGFRRPFSNSLDATASRDVAAEAVAAAAITMVTMSRIAEEVVLWSTTEFGFLHLPDAWATGSSMMPQKKNPDVGELVRGRTGRVIGRLAGLLSTLKALPLGYNRDLQEDKEPLFDALDTTAGSAGALSGLLAGARFDTDRMATAAGGGALATELADALVRRGVPFREAHHRVGRLVAEIDVGALTGPQLASAGFEEGDLDLLSAETAVASRVHHGGTAPAAVAAQLEALGHAVAGLRERASVGSANVDPPAGRKDPGDVAVRPFSEDDFIPIRERVAEWYSQPMQAIVLRRFVLHFGSTSFVAWRDGERVGYVIGWFPQDEPDEVFVHSITMAPGERGRGTGRLLYARLAEAAKAKGKRRMAATIRPQNEGSLAFHRALGFSFRTAGAVADGRGVPVLVDWDGPGEDRVLAEAAIEDLRFG